MRAIISVLVCFTAIFIIHAHCMKSPREEMMKKGRDTAFRLASYYGNHMVLQRAPTEAVMWGYAEVGAQIRISFAEANYTDIAEPGMFGPNIGVWKIVLKPQTAGGPHIITITSKTIEGVSQMIKLEDIMFGDVWICSGQSNMQFPVRNVYNAGKELNDSSKYTHVRFRYINMTQSPTPLYDLLDNQVPWSLPSRESLPNFSAVCWFFGRDLFGTYGVPIGLIQSTWGGTHIEAWSPPDVMEKCNATSPSALIPVGSTDIDEYSFDLPFQRNHLVVPKEPSVLWNAMIHPLLNLTIKGGIWYQGEANSGNPQPYKCLFPAMISAWREWWHVGSGGQTDPVFPFGFVQLCTSNNPEIGNSDIFTGIRWAQTAWYGYTPNPAMPNVFMATAIDLPDLQSTISPIHPRDKQDVGARLALSARAIAYNEKGLVYQGPFPTKLTVNHTEHTIAVVLANSGGGKIKLVGAHYSYEACCSFHSTCQPTDPWVIAPVKQLTLPYTVQLSYDCLGAKPVALRYLWRDYPCTFKKCTVYSSENSLPALPFWLAL